jgi:hypothetical protein
MNPETESQAYSQGAQAPLDWHANGLPAVRKEVEPEANFDRRGHMVIHTENQAAIFETEKTKDKNVHRSFFFDEVEEPQAEGPTSTAY